MVIAAIIGMGLGMTGGIMLGGQIFKDAGEVEEQRFKSFDIEVDHDENVPEPIVTGTVTSEYRQVLRHAPKWTTWPDFEQCRWLNDAIKWLWPGLNGAICKQVIDILGPILDDVVAKQPILDAIVVDQLDLGPAPLRLAGVKVYNTKDDEVIMECPIQWGSLMKLHVSACVRVGPASIYIPVKIEDLQLDAVARVTMRPLVDKLPCIGAIQIALTDVPFTDLTLKLINNWDILSLPFIHDAVLMGVKVGTEPMLVYPNQLDIPLMENSGLAKPPVGMLEITVEKALGLKSGDTFGKGDPYVSIQIQERLIPTKEAIKEEGGDPDMPYDVLQDEIVVLKEHPTHDTSKKSNTSKPEWNEHFKMLIPDLGPAIVLAIKVMDYDLIGKDEVMGEYEMVLDRTNEEAGFLRDASEAFPLSCNLLPGRKKGQPRKMGKPRGELKLNVQYTPFFNAEAKPGEGTDGEDPAKAMEAAARARAARPISDTTKGVLTVDLTRCTDLPSSKNGCNSYVQVKLLDPDSPEGPESHNTDVVINEQSPRFRAKFDFVYISATSMLTLTVYEKAGVWDSVMKLGKKEDAMLGKVRIPVKDVVKPGRLKDAFPLQEAEQGDMHLCLTWQGVERDD